MSTLEVDKIQGVATAGSLNITGEGNSTTTNLQQGLSKQWSNNTISTNTHTIQDSFNTSSLTDDGAGRTDMVFTNNMNAVRYSITSTCSLNGGHLYSHLGNNTLQATNHYRINTADYSGTVLDYDCMCNNVCGDLA
tara:strand:+ start:1858 stop:2265 length:408 start_codon:yes stop_codon:yes gene_type:complete